MYSILDLIQDLDEKNKIFLENYFKNAPIWILNECRIVDVPQKEIFINELDKVENIHILLEGTVKATDYRLFNFSLDFFWFDAVEVFGVMEAVINCERYMTTLVTVTACKFILISKDVFIKWMKNDPHALFIQTSRMTAYLLEQARRERLFLLMDGSDRILLFFMGLYKSSHQQNTYIADLTRQEISDATGLSIKTVNRSIAKLAQEGYFQVKKGKIVILPDDYNKIEQAMSLKGHFD